MSKQSKRMRFAAREKAFRAWARGSVSFNGFVPVRWYKRFSASLLDPGCIGQIDGSFVAFAPSDDGVALLDEIRRPAPEVCGPHRPLFRGEIGTIDCGFRFVQSPASKA